jgi:hypothetical protein
MSYVHILRAVGVNVLLTIGISADSAATTVWTGPYTSFAKPSNADWTLPQYQDQLTANVALTRADSQGMFNITQEASFNNGSPVDTAWATDLNNPGETIAATNWAELEFTTWVAAYDNSIGPNIVGRNAVVHLISDDVYLDVQFTAYGGGGSGGGFAYRRSTPVPEPTTATLLLTGIAGFAAVRRGGR